MAWIAAVAFILLQISISMMPMPAVAAPVVDDGAPCKSMMMDGAPMDMAMGDQLVPNHGADYDGKASCPLMKVGGCFAMCATVMPSTPVLPAAERMVLTLPFIESQGAPLVISPPQRPPLPL